MNNKFKNKLTKPTVRNKQNTDFSSLQKSSGYIDNKVDNNAKYRIICTKN